MSLPFRLDARPVADRTALVVAASTGPLARDAGSGGSLRLVDLRHLRLRTTAGDDPPAELLTTTPTVIDYSADRSDHATGFGSAFPVFRSFTVAVSPFLSTFVTSTSIRFGFFVFGSVSGLPVFGSVCV